MQFLGDDGGAFRAIARQHDQPFDALPAQGLDGRGGFGPQHVRYLNGSEVGIGHGDVDDAALTGGKRGDADARILKQERIADEERPPLVPGGEALAGDFLGFHRFQGKTVRAGSRLHDGAGDGVRRTAFHQPGGLEHVFLGNPFGGQDAGHFKDALGQGSGLVESHGLDVVQGVEHMPALDEDALLGRGADAAEVAERNGDHERAGA